MPAITPQNRGSQWKKWDLHVHTPASELEHSLGTNWDAYVERLIESAQRHQIAAIATADYFTIEGYDILLKYYNDTTHLLSVKDQSVPLCIIPGVELRLNIFNRQDESINLHVFFDPGNCSSRFITQNFLEELRIDYHGSSALLKEQNLWAIGKSVNDGTKEDYGYDFSRFELNTLSQYTREALKVITLPYSSLDEALKNIDEILEKKNLPPKTYLVAVVGKGHGGISSLKWFEDNKNFSRAGLVRENLTHQADMIFSNSPMDRKFYLGERVDTPPSEIETRFRKLKPCVWGSDGHSLENLLHPSNGNTFDYTWIKTDVSFEGLKQITHEPELRVRVQCDNPNEEEIYARIETLALDFPDDLKIRDKGSTEEIPFCIQGRQSIALSSNLTCIIGGRGSGKSTLIHLLYNLDQGREIDRLAEVNSPLFDLQLGSKDVLGKIRSLTKADTPPRTEFFLQNEVEKFAKDINQMSTLVRARLYGLSAIDDTTKNLHQIEEEWQATVDPMDELISSYDKIVRVDQQIAAVQKQRNTLRKQTQVIGSEEYKNLQDEIKQLADKISAFETYTQEQGRISLEISTLIKNIKRLEWNQYEAQSVLNALTVELESRKAQLQESFDRERKKHKEAGYATQLNNQKAQLKAFLKEKRIPSENIGEIARATEQITALDAQIKSLERERAPHQEVSDRKTDTLLAYKQAYSLYESAFGKVAEKLQQSLGGLKFDDQETNISFQLQTNDQALRDLSADFIKQNNPSKVSLRSDNIQNVLFGSDAKLFSELIADPSKIVETVNNSEVADVHTQILKQLINDPVFVERLHLRMQRHHFDIGNIQIQTRLGEKLLQNTSFGERCGIVIAIALVAGTNPIVIDQPEDNLDGKYISRVLVPLIRYQKQRRQIVLVTRDANIAIGSDSELILILDKESGGIKLLPVTIENKVLRSKYIWILDGGETAFRKREDKYAIPRGV